MVVRQSFSSKPEPILGQKLAYQEIRWCATRHVDRRVTAQHDHDSSPAELSQLLVVVQPALNLSCICICITFEPEPARPVQPSQWISTEPVFTRRHLQTIAAAT